MQLNVIDCLSMCTKLNNLDLTNSAISDISDYRSKLKTAIPSLLILDGFGFDEIGATVNMTECSSSLTSDFSKESASSISDQIVEINTISRPLSGANKMIDAVVIDSRRPSTAGEHTACGLECDKKIIILLCFKLLQIAIKLTFVLIRWLGSSSICSAGEPIVGNIVNKVRRKRRDKMKQLNSDSSSTSTSLIESTSQHIASAEKFPKHLPQIPVKLEMGVIDTDAFVKSNEMDSEQDVHQLIEMCRKWRELSQKSRRKLNADANM